MKIFPWDETTKEAISPVEKNDSHPNPIGRCETDIPIPDHITTGYAARAVLTTEGWFSTWELVIDKRGAEYWDQNGTKHVITDLGCDIPAGSLTIPPTSPFHTTHDGTSWLVDEGMLSIQIRAQRDGKIAASYAPAIQQISRWIDEAESGSSALAYYKNQRSAWHAWADALCDLPDQSGFPWADGDVPWPEQPPKPMRYVTVPV